MCKWLVGPRQPQTEATTSSAKLLRSCKATKSICKATYSGGSICESGLAVHESQDCRYRAITMLLILVEVSVKVACLSTTATDCRHRAITMLLILVEVSVKLLILVEVYVKVAWRSTTATDCGHRAITMLLILVEVSVKMACWSTTATDCRHRAITMLLILVEVSVKMACWSTTATDCRHRAITMLLILVEVSLKVACRSTIARLQPQTYLHTTYSGGSICECGCQSTTATDCSHRLNTMLLILVEVSVKVVTATDSYLNATYLSGSICKSSLPVDTWKSIYFHSKR